MADYSFGYGGIGSGLDISTMVSQLIAADRAPQDARLNKLEAAAKFKLSGLGSITSAFNTLKTALDNLQKADALASRKVETIPGTGVAGPDGAPLTATVSGSTPAGRYQVEVHALASAPKLVGAGVPEDATFDAGILRLEIGDNLVEIAVEAGATLHDVRGAINDAAARHGVQAAVLVSDEGHHLSIAGSRTGAQNAITLTAEGGDGLQALVTGLREHSPAADARVTIDGLQVTASGNTVTGAVPGMTLQLRQAGTASVDVSADAAASRAVVQGFVDAYNAALKAVTAATSYNSETRTPSALTGDAQVRGAVSHLRNAMGGILADLARQGLDAKTLGLQTRGFPDADGSLVLDATTFDAAMREDAAAITAAFSGSEGLAARLNAVVGGYVGSDGAFTVRHEGLNDQIKDVGARREALDARMENVARRYQSQFVALDALMAQMSTTSSYLAQQINMLSMQAQAR